MYPGRCPGLGYYALSGQVSLLDIDLIGHEIPKARNGDRDYTWDDV
jgi:hypothetical protein